MATFLNRSEFIDAQSSDKITLAQIDGKARLYVFAGPTANIYSKVTPYFVSGLQQDNQQLTEVANLASVVEGTFYYDPTTSTLYARFFGDIDPQTVQTIARYRFFFGSKPVQLPHNLQNIAEFVDWDGRIVSAPGYKHKIGIEQDLTSLIGQGTLKLANNDGGLDDIFESIIFENQEAKIYSYNQDLEPSDARILYRGTVQNKSYNGREITFRLKDQIHKLLDSPPLEAYGDNDNVADSVKGQYKRRVYGRVDGLRCQATDQIANGIILTGTVASPANSTILTGTGTSFLSETLQGDTVIVGTQEFEIAEVVDNTTITLSDETEFAFSGQNATLQPSRGTPLRNRTFLATGHVCAEVSHNVVNALQFNRIILDDTAGLFAGDFVEFVGTGERIEIKTVAPGNIIVLVQNVINLPAIGSQVIRRPIQEVYVNSDRVNADDFTIFNTAAGCGVTLDTDVEFNLGVPQNTALGLIFTNGNRSIAAVSTDVALSEIFQPGDFVKPNDITYSTFYRIVNVGTASLDIETAFADPSINDTAEYIVPDYITDDSIISVNILGKTKDNTANGEWIQTAADSIKDLITEIGFENINDQSFVDGALDANQLVSMAIPEQFTSKSLPNLKSIVDKLNKSVNSSLTLDNDLDVKYQVLNVYVENDLVTIDDFDVIKWDIKTTNGKTFRTAIARYRFTDTDLSTLEDGNRVFSFESEFVEQYIGTNRVNELDLYLYEQRDAEIAAHRNIYYNRLSRSDISIDTDLRLENVEIGDVVILNFDRLYKRLGDPSTRKRCVLVVGKTLNGQRTKLECSDLGNTFNTSSYITVNTAPTFSSATSDEKLIYGYITDNQGIIDDNEDTAGTHLIS